MPVCRDVQDIPVTTGRKMYHYHTPDPISKVVPDPVSEVALTLALYMDGKPLQYQKG